MCSVDFSVITKKHERYKHNPDAMLDTAGVVF